MKPFHLTATNDTPEINMDPNSGEFIIEGSSLPENVTLFYAPVFKWLDEYIKTPNQITQFSFKLKVISSSSSKIFYDIINYINKLSEIPDVCVKVLWFYNLYDDEIREQGLEYKNEMNVPFELVLFGEN